MTDEMVWALREKHRKGTKIRHMAVDYGIPRRVIAAVVGMSYRDREYVPCADLWTIRELLRAGYDMDAIAALFGMTHKTLANVITKNGDLYKALDRRG